jgi:ankyrin repeat protein
MNCSNIQDQLVAACYHGEVELIKKLIKEGAKIDEPDSTKKNLPIETALMCDSSIEPLRTLIQYGVNLNRVIIRSSQEMSPLHFAMDELCFAIDDMYGVRDIDDINDAEPISLLKVKLLVENGADLHALDKRSFKPVDYLFIMMVHSKLYQKGKQELRHFWRNILREIIPDIDDYLVDSLNRVQDFSI